jgi:ribonuclease P protein component
LPGEDWKFAVLVGKKLGSAPERNRHKRWVREIFRKQRSTLPQKGSIIVRFHQTAEGYAQLQDAFLQAYRSAVAKCGMVD